MSVPLAYQAETVKPPGDRASPRKISRGAVPNGAPVIVGETKQSSEEAVSSGLPPSAVRLARAAVARNASEFVCFVNRSILPKPYIV
jgi:hypothetical protein